MWLRFIVFIKKRFKAMKIRRIKLDICQLKIGLTWTPLLLFSSLRDFFLLLLSISAFFREPQTPAHRPITTSSPPQADAFTFTSCSPLLLPLLHFRAAAAERRSNRQSAGQLELAGTSTSRRFQAVQIGGKGLNSSFEPSILRFRLDFLISNFRVLDAICSI